MYGGVAFQYHLKYICTIGGKNCIFIHRDQQGNIINMGKANTVKPKGKAKANAKAKGKAGTCISLEEQSSRETHMPLDSTGNPQV